MRVSQAFIFELLYERLFYSITYTFLWEMKWISWSLTFPLSVFVPLVLGWADSLFTSCVSFWWRENNAWKCLEMLGNAWVGLWWHFLFGQYFLCASISLARVIRFQPPIRFISQILLAVPNDFLFHTILCWKGIVRADSIRDYMLIFVFFSFSHFFDSLSRFRFWVGNERKRSRVVFCFLEDLFLGG